MRSYISIGTEFQFGVMKTLRMDDGDGCTTMYMYFTDLSILKHLKCFYIIYILPQLKNWGGDFPAGSVAKTQSSQCRGHGFNP